MVITVNGEAREVGDGLTVAALLKELNLDRAACAVEVNEQLIAKTKHGDHRLNEGDRIELVTLVGGG